MTKAAPNDGEPTAPRGDRAVRAAIWLPGLAVAGAAAVATAHGLFEVAVAARVPAGIAWLYPLITDGLALVAYAASARLRGDAVHYAWSVVILAAGLSGLAQASYLAGGATLQASTALRFGVGAWPAVAAALVAHLLYLLAEQPTTTLEPAVAQSPVGESDDEGESSPPPAPSATSVQPVRAAVQAEPYVPEPVRPVLYDEVAADLVTRPLAPEGRPGPAGAGASGEQPDVPVEHPGRPAVGRPPRERARAAALHHAARHGALPTVSELEALAAVSRGTASTVLKALREHPNPLHLVPDNPDPETQP